MPLLGNFTNIETGREGQDRHGGTLSTGSATVQGTGPAYASPTTNRDFDRHFRPADTRTGPRLRRTPATPSDAQRIRLVAKIRKEQEKAAVLTTMQTPPSAQAPTPSGHEDAPAEPWLPKGWLADYRRASQVQGFVFTAGEAFLDLPEKDARQVVVWVVIDSYEDLAQHRAFRDWVGQHPALHPSVSFDVQRRMDSKESGPIEIEDLGYPSTAHCVRLWSDGQARLEVASMKIVQAFNPWNGRRVYREHGGHASTAAKVLLSRVGDNVRRMLGDTLREYEDARAAAMASDRKQPFIPDELHLPKRGLHYVVVPERCLPYLVERADWRFHAVLHVHVDPSEQGPLRPEKLEL